MLLGFSYMAGRAEMGIPECFAFQLQMADCAEERAGGRVGGVFMLDAAGCAFILEERADVCHCDRSQGRGG